MEADRPIAFAQHRSRCAVCDEDIEEGEEIAYLDNEGEWVHAACADGAEEWG